MNKRLVLTLAISTAILGACGKAELLVKPRVPDPVTEIVTATISFGSDTVPESVHSRGHTIKGESSIVINVPKKDYQRQSEMLSGKEEFQTDDFFNEAEQEIEKGLIERGFSVLSRAKFEAKLRQMRDEANAKYNYDDLPSEAYTAIRGLEDDHKAGRISRDDMLMRSAEIRRKYRDEDAGKSRNGENELTDIAEVIRAAQDGEIRADYILQINRFDTNKRLTAYSDLRKDKNIIEFMDKYPSLRNEMNREENHLLECAISGAEFNAKLINVATGSIVWIGNFEANELNTGIETITVRMGQHTAVTNERDVERFIHHQNTDDARKRRKKRPVQIPEWEYQTNLIPYTITSGTCNKTWKLNRQNATQLTRSVARDLIKTIKVQY